MTLIPFNNFNNDIKYIIFSYILNGQPFVNKKELANHLDPIEPAFSETAWHPLEIRWVSKEWKAFSDFVLGHMWNVQRNYFEKALIGRVIQEIDEKEDPISKFKNLTISISQIFNFIFYQEHRWAYVSLSAYKEYEQVAKKRMDRDLPRMGIDFETETQENLDRNADLYLGHFTLLTLPASIEKLHQLKDLRVQNNWLRRIFNFNFPKLESLDVSHNYLLHVPSCDKMVNLKTLKLDNNELTDIFNFVLPKLEELDLSFNRLGEIPDFDLPELRTLNLQTNFLEEVPNFKNLPKLKELYLGYNLLEKIPSFKRAKHLEVLKAKGNPLRTDQKIKLRAIKAKLAVQKKFHHLSS